MANAVDKNDPFKENRERLHKVSNQNEAYLKKLKNIRKKTDDPEKIRAYMSAQKENAPKSNVMKLDDQKNLFIKILMAQLTNQGLDPPKTEKFVQQLSSFVTNEQLIEVNKNLKEQGEKIKAQQFYAASNLMGTEVDFESKNISLQNGQAFISYEVPEFEDLKEVKISITDKDGIPQNELSVPYKSGKYDIVWDGKNVQGLPCPNGIYTISITGFQKDNERITLKSFDRDIINGVIPHDDQIFLRAGNREIPLESVGAFNLPRQTATHAEKDKSLLETIAALAEDSPKPDKNPIEIKN